MEKDALKQKLVTDVKEVITDAESLIKATADDISESAKSARAKLATRLEAAKAQLYDFEEIVKEKAIAGAKETDRMIREHPYETVGVAFGLGLLIGFLINRR